MKIDRSFGIIVIDKGWVLMVNRPKAQGWDFPKGHANKGETDIRAALRELEEETGYVAAIRSYNQLFYSDYIFNIKGKDVFKQIYFWIGDHPENGVAKHDDSEMENGMTCDWIPIDKVADMIKFKPMQQIWKEVRKVVKK